MTFVKHAVVVAIGVTVPLWCAAPVAAEPGNEPCELAVTFLCKFMPIAPTLDHDIDLTRGPATINGVSVPQLPASNPSAAPSAPPPSP